MTRRVRIAPGAFLAVALIGGVPAYAAGPAPAAASGLAAIEERVAVDPEHAITLARTARAQLAPEDARGVPGATLLWLEGEAQVRVGDPYAGLKILDDARRTAIRARAPRPLLADITLSQGSALTDAGRVADALVTLQRAHDMFVAVHDSRSRARALILIALLYVSAHDYEGALRYFSQAGEVYPNDAGLAVAVENGRGNALLALRRVAEAQAEFRRALEAARTLRSAPAIVQSAGNLALAQLRGGDVDGAWRSATRALAIAARPGATSTRPQLLAVLADIALKKGDIAHARQLVEQSFTGTDATRTVLADRDAHEIAHRVFVAANDPAAALAHLTALKRLDDQATEIARSTSAALAAARFDYANQELRITRLKAAALSRTIAFERATAQTQRMVLYFVVGATLLVIALLAIGLALIGRSRNRERAANRDLAAGNAQLEKLSRAKTEFLATTSHEIRTPLNGILGMTQVMIAGGGLDRVTRERLGVVRAAGLTMRALVDDILDMAKIETGRLTVEAAPLDLRECVTEAARLWREPALAKGLRFEVELGDAPQWITGDAARLRQVVFNLLSNAVKFTEAGSVSLLVAQEGDRLRIAVADSGIGIDGAAQPIIFESFRQADAGTTRRFGGTGLGLSISRSLAQAMGGDVAVTSRVGAGSCFTLDLPLVPATAPVAAGARGGLLIVERNPITRAMFRALFEPLGMVTFSDADDALASIARVDPDQVLVDAATFGRAPAELAALVAAAHHAPVALLTEALGDRERQEVQAIGLTKVIEKPISKKGLVDAIGVMPRRTVKDAA